LRILLIDNYDSFVYNLYQSLGVLGVNVDVVRNDKISVQSLGSYDGFVVSPGPGDPRDPKRTGVGPTIIKDFGVEKPVLGVCLGHQEIVYVFGGRIRSARMLKHGEKSLVRKLDGKLFSGLPDRFYAGRYHSLVGDLTNLPSELRLTAISVEDGEVMGIEHVKHPVFGVQFHPESVLTKNGPMLLKNFVRECKK
jgi:anthranilate synthase component 2